MRCHPSSGRAVSRDFGDFGLPENFLPKVTPWSLLAATVGTCAASASASPNWAIVGVVLHEFLLVVIVNVIVNLVGSLVMIFNGDILGAVINASSLVLNMIGRKGIVRATLSVSGFAALALSFSTVVVAAISRMSTTVCVLGAL